MSRIVTPNLRVNGLRQHAFGSLLWDKANAYPTLDFDFAQNKSLTDGRTGETSLISFSRSSMGTYVDSDGLIKRSAVNSLLYSEQLDQSWWKKTGTGGADVTVSANQTTSPDGKQTAEKIIPTATLGPHFLQSQDIAFSSGVTYTFSVYAKKAEYAGASINIGASRAYATFNLNTNTVNLAGASLSDFVSVSGDIESLGDGWVRLQVTATSSINQTRYVRIAISNDENSTDPSGNSFSGDGISGIFFWGAQLEEGTTATPYIRTTSTISGAPRFDHDPVTGESLGLLVEEARTNLEDYSDMSSGAALVGSAVLSPNNSVGPDGATSAATLTTNNATSQQGFATFQSSSGSTNHTFSIFAKANGVDHIQLIASSAVFGFSVWGNFDLTNGVAGTMGAAVINHGIEDFGDGWYRVFITGLANGSSGGGGPYMVDSASTARAGNVTGDGTSGVLLFGYQFEQGSFPSSYIPTSGSAVTRAADVAAVQDEDFSTTNLLSYSESFDVGWNLQNVTISPNVAVAPDGQLTADLYYPNTSGGIGGIRILEPVSISAGTYTMSVYAKASGIDWIYLASPQANTLQDDGWVNVSNGQVGYTGANLSITTEDVGDGWYRVNWTGPADGTTDYFFIAAVDGDNQKTVTANGTDGIYLWGASLTATEYPVEYTTTRNLYTDSQDFERSSWTKYSAAIDNDVAQAPDGTNSADKMVPSVGTTYSITFQSYPTDNLGRIFSIYLKEAGVRYAVIRTYNGSALSNTIAVDLQDGSITYNNGSAENSVTSVGNGWYRITANADMGTFANAVAGVALSDTPITTNTNASGVQVTGDGTKGVYLWGAQLEPGTVATDYVRTVDTVGKEYRWYEPTEGTVFVEADTAIDVVSVPAYGFDAGSSATLMSSGWRIGGSSAGTTSSWIRLSSADQAFLTRSANINDFNNALGLKYNDFNMASAGLLATPDTSGNVPTFDRMRIGSWSYNSNILNGHIKRLTYWPRRLSDAVLQSITS